MSVEGVDFSVRHTPERLDCLRDRNVKFAARYISGGGGWKRASRAELDELAGRGIAVVSVHQARNTQVGDFTLPYAARDAVSTVAAAIALGQPAGTTIYFAVDYNAPDRDMPVLRDYLVRARNILADSGYHIGVYGHYGVIDAMRQHVPFLWQTYAWSGGAVHTDAHLLQYHNGANLCGGTNGRDRAFAYPGWWSPAGPVTVDLNPPEPEVAGDAMTVAELQAALNRLGMRAGAVDGQAGPATRLAISRFQLAYAFEDIAVDGEAGPQTWKAIRRCLGDSPASDRLSPHFYVYELRSRTRPKGPKDNDCFMHRDTLKALEVWRSKVGKPLGVVSGYRTPTHNRAVGGARSSQHTYGDAPELGPRMFAGRAVDLNRGFRSLAATLGDGLFSGVGHRAGQVTHVDTRTSRSVGSPSVWEYR